MLCCFVCAIQVAIKTVPKLRKSYVDMVRNEVAILRLFQHSRIIRLYDVYEDAASAYLVFEWCPGGELFEVCIIFVVTLCQLIEPEL